MKGGVMGFHQLVQNDKTFKKNAQQTQTQNS